jgi:hypothetical protein
VLVGETVNRGGGAPRGVWRGWERPDRGCRWVDEGKKRCELLS